MKVFLDYISALTGKYFLKIRPISGGDISAAFLLETETQKFFLKTNGNMLAKKMFRAEQQGLSAIEATGTIAVPHVYLVDEYERKAFLLMDFVESKRPADADFYLLGKQLAHLHQSTNRHFGFASDNFIGSLPQSNQLHSGWAEFYWYERISRQLKLALDARLISNSEIPDTDAAISLFRRYFGDVAPALLHGDLWGGNFLISTDGTPFLIDPAVYYGHALADTAMTKLFGGFGAEFYRGYHEIIDKPVYYEEIIELYQLYYLLVHLNLFGMGYYTAVASILKKYF